MNRVNGHPVDSLHLLPAPPDVQRHEVLAGPQIDVRRLPLRVGLPVSEFPAAGAAAIRRRGRPFEFHADRPLIAVLDRGLAANRATRKSGTGPSSTCSGSERGDLRDPIAAERRGGDHLQLRRTGHLPGRHGTRVEPGGCVPVVETVVTGAELDLSLESARGRRARADRAMTRPSAHRSAGSCCPRWT